MGKLDWSGICATSKGRHQCSEENCIIYPICLIKDISHLTSKVNNNQRKKDKDDGSNVSLSADTKQSSRKTNKDEHMSKSVDTDADTDALTKTSNEASRIDGRRLKSELNNEFDS